MAGAGGILFDPGGNKITDFAWGLGRKTNNEAEWLALIFSLEMASNYSIANLKVYGDSRHVIQIMRRGYASPGSKADRYLQRIKTISLSSKASFFHILRENNRVADLAANQGFKLSIGQTKDHQGNLGFHYLP